MIGLCYIGGCVLGLIMWVFRRGDYVTYERYPIVGLLVTTIGWPLILPFSAYALVGSIIYITTGKLLPFMSVDE